MSGRVFDRRTVLLAGGAALAASLPRLSFSGEADVLEVYDSRLGAAGIGRGIDVARGDLFLWKTLVDSRAQRVVGTTSWADFVLVRGILEERGRRVVKHRFSNRLMEFEFSAVPGRNL